MEEIVFVDSQSMEDALVWRPTSRQSLGRKVNVQNIIKQVYTVTYTLLSYLALFDGDINPVFQTSYPCS